MMVRPRIVYWMSFLLLGICLSIPIQIAILYQHSFSEIGPIFQKVSLPNMISMALILLSATLYFQISPYLKFIAPLTIVSIFWNNYLVGSFGQDFALSQTMTGALLFSGIYMPLLRKDLRQILSHPQQRWWRRSPRFQKQVGVILNPFVGSTLEAQTFDLSESGAFIPIQGKPWAELPKVGERLKMSIHFDTLRKIRCEAVVVRAVEARGNYPQGIGIRFTEMDSTYKKSLNNFLHH